ncbi:hypothetical protein V1522DRAFT_421509 [Lipomyces starkeyi]
MSTLSAQVQSSTKTLNRHSRDIDYQRALDFLVANEQEQSLQIKLPFDKFEALESYTSNLYGDKKYPYVDNCPTISTANIYTAPTPLNGQISSQLQHLIQRSAENVLIRQNRPELARKLQASGKSSDRAIFGGYSRKYPKPWMETGLSENYEKLQKDVTLWLDGMHCNTAIPVCLQEYPPKNEHRFTLESFDVFQEVMAKSSVETPFGPYIYDDHTWFGQLAQSFAEVSKRSEDGTIQSQTYRLIREGKFVIQVGLILGSQLET